MLFTGPATHVTNLASCFVNQHCYLIANRSSLSVKTANVKGVQKCHATCQLPCDVLLNSRLSSQTASLSQQLASLSSGTVGVTSPCNNWHQRRHQQLPTHHLLMITHTNTQTINQSISGLSGATTARTTSWMMSGYDCLNKKTFNNRQKVDSEFAAKTPVGSVFQMKLQPQRLGC